MAFATAAGTQRLKVDATPRGTEVGIELVRGKCVSDGVTTVSTVQAHRRQFIIGPEPVVVRSGWQVAEIAPSLVLSHCPTLPVQAVDDADGVRWHLLGLAVQADPDRAAPTDDLARTRTVEIKSCYASWMGRWILVGNGELHLDAGGTLSCYYRRIHGTRRSELWASSSLPLITSLPGRAAPVVTAPRPVHGYGMDWYPPPLTRVPGVHRLLVSQVLGLADTRPPLLARPLLPAPPANGYEATLELIERTLVAGIANIARRFDEVWIALTAGFDSRLILAAAYAADVPVHTFTQERGFVSMPRGDRDVPPALARRLGVPHNLVPRGERSEQLRAILDEHTGGESVDQDRSFFARGQWHTVPPTAVVLRGGVFEVAQLQYKFKFPEPAVDDLAAYIAERFQLSRWQRGSFPHVEGIAAWLDWVAMHPEPGVDWRDRMYYEQRVGGWVGTTEQALDLLECELINPAACRRLLAAAYSAPVEIRRRRQHHVDLIARMAPVLLEQPLNPQDGSALRLARRVRRSAVWAAKRAGDRVRGPTR